MVFIPIMLKYAGEYCDWYASHYLLYSPYLPAVAHDRYVSVKVRPVRLVRLIVPLNVNFALSEPSPGTLATLICAFRKFDEYSICIAILHWNMILLFTNNVH